MASTLANPPLFSDELVATADEREVLAAFLDLYRDTVVRKLRGVTRADAHRQVVPTLTTLDQLVRHLRRLEIEWFQCVLGRTDMILPDAATGGPGGTPAESIDELLASYQDACRRSREMAGAFSLHDTVPHERMGQVSLRWIYVHMIEETARHAGHVDVVRELVCSNAA